MTTAPTVHGPAPTALDLDLEALSNRVRMRLLALLGEHGEQNVSELSALSGLAVPLVSHNLGVLRRTGFVADRREGHKVYFSARPERLAGVGEALVSLARASGHVEGRPRRSRKPG